MPDPIKHADPAKEVAAALEGAAQDIEGKRWRVQEFRGKFALLDTQRSTYTPAQIIVTGSVRAELERIATVFNSHDALVWALADLLAAVGEFMEEEGYLDRKIADASKAAVAALAKEGAVQP